jgi:hypothetical protein
MISLTFLFFIGMMSLYTPSIFSFVLPHHPVPKFQNYNFNNRKGIHSRLVNVKLLAKRRTKITKLNNEDDNTEEILEKNGDISTNSLPNEITYEKEQKEFTNSQKTVVFKRKGILDELEDDLSKFKDPAANSYKDTKSIVVSPKKGGLLGELEEDLYQFNQNNINNSNQSAEEGGILKVLKDGFGVVFSANFFLIIFFLIWFIAATVSKEAFSNYFLIEKFQDIFQPIIQPSLGLLMGGSVLSGVINKDKTEEEKKQNM